eukprot:TRINITY_DN4850_c0_g1_i1.p1 TRINITY_DN4850_c0_g1~~TRINITY_DN4850_c0_g1_i1.p1  ORF type:complete len:120 (+),score=21.38 TRINITY_DN4850_c0_g1_i1:28-387(+)
MYSVIRLYILIECRRIKKGIKLAISYLNLALEINDCDATAHHDLALILSHDAIANYNDAIYHWLCANELDGANPIYTQQIAYIYQYSLTPPQYGSPLNIIIYHCNCMIIMSQIIGITRV